MKISHYHISAPVKGVCKQYAIWGREKNAVYFPLVYLQRPKWITDDSAWNKIVNSIRMQLRRDFEVK